MKYVSEYAAKESILEVGKRMYARGFVASNDGNISCRVGENAIWTTPTGVSKGFMTSEMLVKTDLNGNVLSGNRAPSSELKMHLRVYRENSEVFGVTHAHPPISTAFAVAGQPLDTAILTEAVLTLGEIPIAPYATPGTQEIPDSIGAFVNNYNGALLANHGALTWGKDVFEAWYRLESMEHYANVLMYTDHIIKKQNLLTSEQVNTLTDIRNRNGVMGGGTLVCADCPKKGTANEKEGCTCAKRGSHSNAGENTAYDYKTIADAVERVISKLNLK